MNLENRDENINDIYLTKQYTYGMLSSQYWALCLVLKGNTLPRERKKHFTEIEVVTTIRSL